MKSDVPIMTSLDSLTSDRGDFTQRRAGFVSHIRELRNRLIVCVVLLLVLMGVAYPFIETIYGFLAAPLIDVLQNSDMPNRGLIFTGLPDLFLVYLKLSFYTGLFFGLPIILIQIWRFIAPGLYHGEKKSGLFLFIATPVLFYCGAAFVYYFLMPMAWSFFIGFERAAAIPVQLDAKIDDYLSLTVKLIIAFGLAFELPVLMLLLNKAGIVKKHIFIKGRRYALIAIFAMAALITPPDVISQISLAVPMLLLYEFSLFFMKK